MDRRRKNNRAGNGLAHISFAEIFERQISSKAEPGEYNVFVKIFIQRMADDSFKVVGCTTVIKTETPVYFAATPTKIPCKHIKSLVERCPRHSLYVRAV